MKPQRLTIARILTGRKAGQWGVYRGRSFVAAFKHHDSAAFHVERQEEEDRRWRRKAVEGYLAIRKSRVPPTPKEDDQLAFNW